MAVGRGRSRGGGYGSGMGGRATGRRTDLQLGQLRFRVGRDGKDYGAVGIDI